MSKFLFFSLAKHQTIYFQHLLAQTQLQGLVVTHRQLPFPALGALRRVIQRVDWGHLVEEKCQERRVKGKYEGALYRLLLRLEMLVMALRLQALLNRQKPSAVAVWNGSNRYCQLLLALLPEGVATFFFENGLLPNTTTLDRRGVNYFNSVPRDAAFYRAYAARQAIELQQDVTLIPRKPRVTGQAAITLPERFVFIPFQDDRDTQVRLFSPWIGNMRELFALGERLAAETGWTVVFKEHPSSRESYPELHERTHERLLFANGNATQELIEAAQFIVTLNSTVGLESLLLGKPLLTLGQAFFNVEGVVMHADSADELVQVAKAFPQWPVDEALRKSFLHYLQNEYCVPGRWQDSSAEHLMEVARRMGA
ncbi:MAG: capsular biosynthesis protein [Pseudomonas sp.]